MSRQFQIYALPGDLQMLIGELRRHLEIRLISSTSESCEQTLLPSPLRTGSIFGAEKSHSVNCFMTRGDLADVRLHKFPGESVWRVDESSEVISLGGFDFDGNTLLRGRMYVQDNYLVGGELVSKREVFASWANEVFARTKKLLLRSQLLDAYIGREAKQWAENGGRLASFAAFGKPPIYETYED